MLKDSSDHVLVIKKVGLYTSRKLISFLQCWKILPVLIGQSYTVHVQIKNPAEECLDNIEISVLMHIKVHGEHEPQEKERATVMHLQGKASCDILFQKNYLMLDTGASDLEILACSDKGELTLKYFNEPHKPLVYPYHVEPWRSSVLESLISTIALVIGPLVGLTAWLPTCLRWLVPFVGSIVLAAMLVIWNSKLKGKPCQTVFYSQFSQTAT